MNAPPTSAQAILRELVKHIATGRFNPKDPGTYLGYSQVHDALHLNQQGDTVGNSLKKQGLEQLAEWTKAGDHPAITGLIVDKSHVSEHYLGPGDGYFKLFGKKYPDDLEWWLSQIERSISYDWSPFLDGLTPVSQVCVTQPNSRLTHICFGDANLHLPQIENAAAQSTDGFDWWNINKYAKPGDRIVFYITAPVSAFVACGKVGEPTEPHEVSDSDKWYGPHCFWVNEPQMLPRRVSLHEAKEQFPDWGYLKHPVVTSLPDGRTPAETVERFLDLLQLPCELTEKAVDLGEPPVRFLSTEYRILRDTELARKVKRMHDYKCQICGHVIRLPNGALYAEAHHIQPLGQPHNGADVIGNILCLCPNHHVELDYGVASLDLTKLRLVDGHSVEVKFLEYHNRHVYNRKVQ